MNSYPLTILDKGSSFEGTLIFTGLGQISGAFKGNISSEGTLIIKQTGNVEAEVNVDSVIIEGTFKGNIKAKTKITLKRTANVEGVLEAPVVSIEDGVNFNGSIKVIE